MNLELVDRIYACSTDASIIVHEVADTETKQFARDLNLLEKSAAEFGTVEHLKPLFRLFRRIRFVLAAAPIPPQHNTVKLDAALYEIQQMLPVLHPSFPQLIDKAVHLASGVRALMERSFHPLEVKFVELLEKWPSGGSACVAVKDSRLGEAAAAYFRGIDRYGHLHVVSPFELRDAVPCGRMFVFGSPRWFADDGFSFMFHAPRAERIDVISFAWVGNQLRIDPVFPTGRTSISGQRIRIIRDVQREVDVSEKLETDQLLPTFNTEAFKHQIHLHSTSHDGEDPEDVVEARVALLAGSRAVFLDQSDGARSYTLDLLESPEESEDEEAFLVRELNTDIEAGKFLLLRTQGGGDLIPGMAEKILDAKAAECNALQQKWKGLLKWYVQRCGRELTANRLAALGATAARPVNIGNWIRTRNIRPGADQDFNAVLKLVGLESEGTYFFENAVTILNARKRAGTQIRRLLLEAVKRANLAELTENGTMSFQLSELGAGGSMTAFRVEKILPGTHLISYSKVSRPFPVSDDLWL